MRGKATGTPDFPQYSGITPAYAGKRNRKRVCPAFCRDHPRLCGEKGNRKRVCPAFCRITPAYAGKSEERYCQGCDVIGSPPPMRGKVLDLLEDLCAVGITPAYAGKSFLAYIWDGSS